MNIIHITSHMGGGVGTVLMDWMKSVKDRQHVICLDSANDKARGFFHNSIHLLEFERHSRPGWIHGAITSSDIVLVHYWDHPMLREFLSRPLPPCRLIFWSHKNVPYSQAELAYPDLWLDTSPVQGHGRHIWSTGDISRFLEIKPKVHEGLNIGYVGTVDYKKMHGSFFSMCRKIIGVIPGVHFTLVGDNHIIDPQFYDNEHFTFTGKVDDVAPYLAEMDIFFYPLRPDHYGTCEQALGEAMAAGVVPVVMENPAERSICVPDLKGLPSGIKCRYTDECAVAVKWIRERSDLARIVSYNARERAHQLYNLDRMISEWNAVLGEVMQTPKRERGPLF